MDIRTSYMWMRLARGRTQWHREKEAYINYIPNSGIQADNDEVHLVFQMKNTS